MNEFGDYLRELRGKMSLREASRLTNISHTYIRDLELGKKTDPSDDILKKLAKAYNVPLDNLARKYFDHDMLYLSLEVQVHFETLLEGALEIISCDNKFLPALNASIKELEKEYEEYLETNDHITPEFLRELVSKADWRKEWIMDLIKRIVLMSRDYITKDLKELSAFLSQENITYKNRVLTKEDCNRILEMLNIIFPDKLKEDNNG